jgi:hypothetical protein
VFPNRPEYLAIEVAMKGISSITHRDFEKLVVFENLTLDSLISIKTYVEKIFEIWRLLALSGFTKFVAKDDKSAVFLEMDFKRLSVIAAVSSQGVTLDVVGTNDTALLLRKYLAARSDSQFDCIRFIATLTDQSSADRHKMLVNALAEAGHG